MLLFNSGALRSRARRLMWITVVRLRAVVCWGRVSGSRGDLGLELGNVLSYLLSWQTVSLICIEQ